MMEQDAAPAGVTGRGSRARAAAGSPGGIMTPRQELADGELPARPRLKGLTTQKGLCSRAAGDPV
jgi:hypothetical protein